MCNIFLNGRARDEVSGVKARRSQGADSFAVSLIPLACLSRAHSTAPSMRVGLESTSYAGRMATAPERRCAHSGAQNRDLRRIEVFADGKILPTLRDPSRQIAIHLVDGAEEIAHRHKSS